MLDCSNKSIIIVENIKQSRDTIKLFSYSIGAIHVDITHKASNVISMCENTQYDIIFLGYDLGENKKNGQQILEELRVKQLISRQCIIIMITAEVSQAMVLAALEHKPDEYLVKPYSLKDITSRLSRSLAKKYAMEKIYHAMDENNHKLVISLTSSEIEKESPYKTECLGIISRQYFELKKYKAASKIYEEYKDIPNCQWAHIGLGKIALANKDSNKAKLHFQAIIKQHPFYLSAYDWLAKALESEDQTVAAEEVLENAIFISPLSVNRLKKYASVCLTNENFDKATDAYLKTNELSQNSIHKNPENAILFAESLLEYTDSLDQQEIKKLTGKANKALSMMAREYQEPDLKIIANLLSSRLYLKSDQNSESSALMRSALYLLENNKHNLNNANTITISSSLIILDKKDKADELLKELAFSNPDDTNLLANIENINKNKITDNDQYDAQKALKFGIKLFQESKLLQAIDKLNSALNLFPAHIGIKLNLLQVLITAVKEKKARQKDYNQIKFFFNEFENLQLNENNETLVRFSKIKKSYHKILNNK